MPPRSFFDDEGDLTAMDVTSQLHPCTTLSTYESLAGALVTPPQSPRSKPTVTFASSIKQVHEVLHVKDYTFEERITCWYNGMELYNFKQDAKKVAILFFTGSVSCDTAECCYRGLETRSREGSNRRKRTKNEALSAVLREQTSMIEDDGCIDSETLREVYHCHTIQSRIDACVRGAMDANAAKQLR